METRLYLEGLPQWMNSAALKDLCSAYGDVVCAHVVRDVDGRSLACGHVEMTRPMEVERVIRELNGSERFGVTMWVSRTSRRVFATAR